MSDFEALVALQPVVDIRLQVDRGRLQVGVAELGPEAVEGNPQDEDSTSLSYVIEGALIGGWVT